MTAGKKVSVDREGPVKSKSSSWLAKWIPTNIAKKAKEAFTLFERAVFSDNVEDVPTESNKVQVLELQVKRLQQKVEQLLTTKDQTGPSPVRSSVKANNVKLSEKKKSTVKEVADNKPLFKSVMASEVSSAVPPKPLPFSAGDLMGQKLKKALSSSEVPAAPVAPPKARPFSASDLMNQKLKSAPAQPAPASRPSVVPPPPPPRVQAGAVPPPPPRRDLPTSDTTAASASAAPKQSPAKAVRPVMKPFSSSDLRQVKLGKDKSCVSVAVPAAGKTPVAKPAKAMSMQSALKNAIKSKFIKAQGSPGESSDEETGEISEW